MSQFVNLTLYSLEEKHVILNFLQFQLFTVAARSLFGRFVKMLCLILFI